MVGVPGRSKGCNTCRKRRIACSLDTPQCKQCLKSNRTCGGYQRERIWVPPNQVKLPAFPPVAPNSTPADPSTSNAIVKRAENQVTTAIELANRSLRTQQALVRLPSLPKQIDSMALFHRQLLSEFIHNLFPDKAGLALDQQSLTAEPGRSWLHILPDLLDVSVALETSTIALSAAQIGRLNDNPALVMHGRKQYVRSLKELQKALWDPDLMYRDETLAACHTLSMYEIIECPSENGKGWITHSNGCQRLIELRGPKAHTSDLGHQLFLSCRWSALMHALGNNRKIFFCDPEWMTLPWEGRKKTIWDKMVDILVAGLSVLEAANYLGDLSTTSALLPALEIVRSCWKIETELKVLYKELEENTPGPMFWPILSVMHNPADDLELGKVFPVQYEFFSIHVSRILVLYWAICILLWGGLYSLYHGLATMQPIEEQEQDKEEQEIGNVLDEGKPRTSPVCMPFDISTLPPLQGRDVTSAIRNICQSYEYCTKEENKGLGASIVAFPLQIAIGSLKAIPGFERELNWARAAVQMVAEKGFRILKYEAA